MSSTNLYTKQSQFRWPVVVTLELPNSKQDVNLTLLNSLSGLFRKKILETDPKQILNDGKKPAAPIGKAANKTNSPVISMKDLILKDHINYFLAICHGQTPKLDIPLAFDVLFIAEEWQSPTIIDKIFKKLLSLFEENKYTHDQIFGEMIERYSKVHELCKEKPLSNTIGSSLVPYIAENFAAFLKSNSSLDFQESLILMVLESPYFARPPRSIFDPFILTFISLDPQKYQNYLKQLDPFRSELSILEKAVSLIQKNSLSPKFVLFVEIYKTRVLNKEKEDVINEVFVLKDQIVKLKKYNNYLEEQIQEIDDQIESQKKKL